MDRGRYRQEEDERGERRGRSYEGDGERRRYESRGESRGRGENAGEQEAPELYSVSRARVHSVKPFGLFVRLEGYRAHGLVHLSQVSRHEITQREDSDEVKMQALGAIAGVGEEVWVKVISVKREDGGSVKIGCSMKVVGQSDGRDLDPNNLQVELHDSRPGHGARQKVTLDAVYDVQCTRCGGHGHLKSECYSTGEKVYELLPEDDEDDAGAQQQQQQQPVEERVPPKEKKEKESSKRKSGSKLPDSVTTVEEAKALIASLKEEKKRKKRERKEDRHHKKKKKKERH